MRTVSLPFSLTKTVGERPKYNTLVEHRFIKTVEQMDVDMGAWYRDILAKEAAMLAAAPNMATEACNSS